MLVRALRVIVFAVAAWFGAAAAANAQLCGSDVIVTSGPVSGVYDPFSPAPVTFGSVTLTFTRAVNSVGGGKTQSMAFFMLQPSGSPSGNNIIWPETGDDILFTHGGSTPILNTPPTASQPAGVAVVSWGGAAQPDTLVRTVTVTLDPSYDPVAQPTINFDLRYVCKGTGGYDDVTTPATLTGVIQIAIQVLSGLQASYAGPALDFGDISELTSGGLVRNGVFHIRSSGAYTVALSSGNHFLMTYPGGPNTTPDPGTVGYSLSFLGQSLQFGAEIFPTATCHRAGTNAVQHIPIAVTLLEGGVGKTPAPSYADTLTVTFSPLDDPGLTQPFCSAPP